MKSELKHGQEIRAVAVQNVGAGLWRCRVGEVEGELEVLLWDAPRFHVRWEGREWSGYFFRDRRYADIHVPEGNFRVQFEAPRRNRSAISAHEGALTAPMPGKVLKVFVQVGDAVKQGQPLMVLEAMKMEHQILSPRNGKVAKLFFQAGDRVGQEAELLEIEAD